MLELNLIETLGFAAAALAAGYGLRQVVPPLGRYNIPAPVIGGLLVSLAALAARPWTDALFQFDIALREPLMIAFFTAIGFGASVGLLKKGGPQVLVFLALCGAAGLLQNVVGAGLATMMGQPPLLGVLCGSVTLTGGPATGLAFAPQFEEAGIEGADAIAVAAAMAGIVIAGLVGGPVGTWFVERRSGAPRLSDPSPLPPEENEAAPPSPVAFLPPQREISSVALLQSVGAILIAMWAGGAVSAAITAAGVTLPAYIGAMIVAAAMRNLDEATGWLGLSPRALEEVGGVALSFFLVLALMTLELWKLAAVAAPLAVLLAVQTALTIAFCWRPLFGRMGRDHDAAVMTSGFCGFMLGTTANAMANMDALVRRYGPAPRAFLVVPIVGAFFIDFVNAFLIQISLNWLR